MRTRKFFGVLMASPDTVVMRSMSGMPCAHASKMAAAVPTSVASTLDTTATRSVRRSGSTESPVKSRR